MSFVNIPSSNLQKNKAAVKKETVRDAATAKRLNSLPNNKVSAPLFVASTRVNVPAATSSSASGILSVLNRGVLGKAAKAAATVVGKLGPGGKAAALALTLAGNKVVDTKTEQVTTVIPDTRAEKTFPPSDYQYNLPPHNWSLPVRPHLVDGEEGRGNITQNNHPGNFHRLRRGVIWHWSNGSDIAAVKDGKLTSATALQETANLKDANINDPNSIYNQGSGNANNYKYGFQFLWNPETISSSISRNMDVTPSSADRFRSVSGAFPGQETYQFQILLDRVNDFAFLRAHAGLTSANSRNHPKAKEINSNSPQVRESKNPRIPESAKNYYSSGLGDVTPEMLNNLAKFGTMADLEYLFKALNGDGANQKGGEWATLMLKKTANIGFLSPSLMGFRFGPNAQQQLSFVGWITNISINHTFFTEDMIPLRTTVSFSCDAFAGSTVI
jgi:hypothetical protein